MGLKNWAVYSYSSWTVAFAAIFTVRGGDSNDGMTFLYLTKESGVLARALAHIVLAKKEVGTTSVAHVLLRLPPTQDPCDNPDIIESYEDLSVFYYPLQHIELALKYLCLAIQRSVDVVATETHARWVIVDWDAIGAYTVTPPLPAVSGREGVRNAGRVVLLEQPKTTLSMSKRCMEGSLSESAAEPE
ncbi:hypothetical protein Tco_1042455 [Tanacetum coccineum]|uniref:Uncharacterized protein n=1 Tax=Tanacetum coccineum TaxID=301880 RepID=A0ABQ5GJN9_9ASTR